MVDVITNGTITTQVRLTYEEAVEALFAKGQEKDPTLQMPDFGEGETDAIKINIVGAGTNATFGSMEASNRELVLVLVDNENDPIPTAE